ncbi:MAG: rhodanese-like domain-containing protein [Methanomicrobiales archaeon]|jgi:rhodanese-related sulfurtransferase|nr:rhodanese-like domain-containing protein [Methanomicrobiales archaeon]
MIFVDEVLITWIATILVLLFGAGSPVSYETVNIDAAYELIEDLGEELQILDVRTKEEYALGHIPDAHNINIKDAEFRDQISLLDPNMPTLVYCKSGARAESAASILVSEGFTEIYLMKAEFSSWMKSHPVE